MHGTSRLLSGMLVLSLASPALAPAQTPTLGELARREQERRKGIKSSDKVLTNKDLPASAQQPAPAPASATGSSAPAPAAGTPVASTTPADDKKPASEPRDEAWWRKRLADAREALRRNEMFLDALQTRINALAADFVNRDDPYQRAKIGDDRHKALAEMERVQADIALNKKQIEEIEEEARKAGVPPGWLR